MEQENQLRKGLAVNQKRKYFAELPDYRFSRFGKLNNGNMIDMNWTLQHLQSFAEFKEQGLSAGELKGIITISELTGQVIKNYTLKTGNEILKNLVEHLEKNQGKGNYQRFIQNFQMYFLRSSYFEHIESESIALTEEIIKNWLNVINPAFRKYKPLFDNTELLENSSNLVCLQEIVNYLEKSDVVSAKGYEATSLYDLLRSPGRKYEDSIFEQLEYILEFWKEFLDDVSGLQQALDILREERKSFQGGFAPLEVLRYDKYSEEEEYYTLDKDWMPSLVLLAKSVYVWLHQLSLKYGKPIRHLDEIPDEELKILRHNGINGLWLIGIWERSEASKKIKRMNGNEQAIASAYSLESYRLADDLGGEEAWHDLSRRAALNGIRMGCDMVPNHTGIDSEWIIHHTDWFMQRDNVPYPNYSFNGENLSSHAEIEVRIEDHYYARTDAAVVFELYDRRDGRRRYIYHGNDGTGLPWNDTAQLDYTRKEVREAVIAEIVKIARRIPIIRFDAAMTLAKKHFQRLWFPEPGSGGDIPTRSEYAMSKEEFNRVSPREFWRDVVDKVNEEAPDTLLLAEAFWMMEGYFVRNLGMHRVYNSAFMHMMMREDNAAFRKTIINTLEYDKRILKRYVNFMSNPDEATAIEQFGDDNKYFGVCVLMCTLPGLPMFGHGQIEGFREKYGMEYASPFLEEIENRYLRQRHEKEIFPLLRKRKLFAEADFFRLYDYIDEHDNLNDNVFCFSNYNLNNHTIVFYNNAYEQTSGRIWETTDYILKEDGSKEVKVMNWGDTIGLSYGPDKYLIFTDLISKQEFIRPVDDILTNGFWLNLSGYEYHVFSEFRIVADDEKKRLRAIWSKIGHNGVDSIDKMKRRIRLQPLHDKLQALFTPGMIKNQNLLLKGEIMNAEERRFFLERELFPAIFAFHETFMELAELKEWSEKRLINNTLNYFKQSAKALIKNKRVTETKVPACLIAGWTLFHELKKRTIESDVNLREVIFHFLIHEPLLDLFSAGCGNLKPQQCLDIVFICLNMENLLQNSAEENFSVTANQLLNDEMLKKTILLHSYNNTRWFHKESFEVLMSALEITNRIYSCEKNSKTSPEQLEKIGIFFNRLIELAGEAGYNFDKLIELAQKETQEEEQCQDKT